MLLAKIPVVSATNPVVSYQLDIARSQATKVNKEYEIFITENREKIDANDEVAINKLYALTSKLRDANIDYLKQCLVDYKEASEILRLVPGTEFPEMQSAIMRAQFGIQDSDEKKNQQISSPTTRSNSRRLTSRKKK